MSSHHLTLWIATAASLSVVGCDQQNGEPADMSESPNKEVLDKANAKGEWFHARKVKPLWARQVEQESETVQSIEGEETVQAGDYVCRGEVGDIWPQSADSLKKKYTADGEPDADGWQKFVPRPDAEGVMAIQMDDAFDVKTSWGDLQGKAEDYLLKNYADRNSNYPNDVWIVDQTIFSSTYQQVESEE